MLKVQEQYALVCVYFVARTSNVSRAREFEIMDMRVYWIYCDRSWFRHYQ